MKDETNCCKNNNSSQASGGAVYGLGLIGAAIYFLTSTLGHPNSNNFASNLCSSVKSMMWDTSPFVVLALI